MKCYSIGMIWTCISACLPFNQVSGKFAFYSCMVSGKDVFLRSRLTMLLNVYVNKPVMTQELNTDMESRIVEAATRVFIRRGKAGTSMQHIAAEAGINRTLLNYYFRSKDKLFDVVFQRVFVRFLPDLAGEINARVTIEEKIIRFIDRYHSILKESPYTALFILHEVSTEPDRFVNSIRQQGIRPDQFIKEIGQAMEEGKLKKADPRQLLINLLSLIIFPFAARTIMESVLFNGDTTAFEHFIDERRAFIKTYFMESIKA